MGFVIGERVRRKEDVGELNPGTILHARQGTWRFWEVCVHWQNGQETWASVEDIERCDSAYTEVVRCKECRHSEFAGMQVGLKKGEETGTAYRCLLTKQCHINHWFCADGKREVGGG